MHQVFVREAFAGRANYAYHSNDNAFLNYGDKWFDQRTLVARFEMNKTDTVREMPALPVPAVGCGCHSTARVDGLGGRCGERPPTHGPACIRRFNKGQHPDQKKGDLREERWFRVLRGGELEEFTPTG